MTVQNAPIDDNDVKGLIAASNTDGITPVKVYADPVTHRLLVDLAGGSGTVTSVSVVSANGFAGTVATATTTPAITLSTTITGILKGNGTAISSATDGTDYLSPTTGLKLNQTSQQTITNNSPIFGSLTASQIAAFDSNSALQSLAVATYPSLTELSYVKGVTSAIQTQLNSKIGGLTVGTTTITSGTNTRILYDNSGVLGEYTLTGSGTVAVMQTSPALITPALGVATATSIAIGGATIGSNGLAVTGHVLVEGVTSTGATGTGKFVFDGTPTLVTPVLGVATATSINGLTITTTTGTLTMANGKTLSVAKSLTLDGTDSTTMTFPSTSATIARTDAAQTFTGTQTFAQTILTANAITASSNAATIPVTSGRNIVTNDSANNMTITMTTTSAVNMQTCIVQILDFSGVAKSISWVNTENSTYSVPGTSNGSTSLPLTVGFIYNSSTSKWRCVTGGI